MYVLGSTIMGCFCDVRGSPLVFRKFASKSGNTGGVAREAFRTCLTLFVKRKLACGFCSGWSLAFWASGCCCTSFPQDTGTELTGADVVAEVGDQKITMADVQDQLNRVSRNGQIPATLLPLYAQQVLDQLISQASLEFEADRLGLRVTDEEHADLLRKLVPTAYSGDTFIGMDRYTTEVQTRFQMDVPEFESEVKKELLQQKFQQLVTDGITASPDEVRAEYPARQ